MMAKIQHKNETQQRSNRIKNVIGCEIKIRNACVRSFCFGYHISTLSIAVFVILSKICKDMYMYYNAFVLATRQSYAVDRFFCCCYCCC